MSKMTVVDMTDKTNLVARLDDLTGEMRVILKYHCDSGNCHKLHTVAATVSATYMPGDSEAMCVIVRDIVPVTMMSEFIFEPVHVSPTATPAFLYLYVDGRVKTSSPLTQAEFIAQGGFKWYMEVMGIETVESGPMQA